MATIPVTFYTNREHNRFVAGYTNAAPPTLPTATQGDTWAISLYHLDDGSPFSYHRYPSAISALRFRAAGNAHVYAYGDNNTAPVAEIGPANETVVLSRVQAGQHNSPSQSEVQKVKLPAFAIGGSPGYQLNFPGPTLVGAPSGVAGPKGSIVVGYDWSVAQIQQAIRDLPWYTVFNSTLQPSQSYSQYCNLTGSPDEYNISYQGGSGSDRRGPLEMLTLSTNTLKYAYGWSFNLPLTAADFADVFVNGNGPAYFEALIDGVTIAQLQLTAGGAGNSAPAFTNGPPPASVQLNVPFSFGYSTSGFPIPTFALTSGALPVGLSLSSAGAITGTPTVPGTFTGVVTATNSAGSATQAFSISVAVALPGGGGTGTLPPPIHDLPANYTDGNYELLLEIGIPIPEFREDHPTLIIWRRSFEVRLTSYSKPNMGDLLDGYGYFIRDVNFRDMGHGVYQFERLQHTFPLNHSQPWEGSKRKQSVIYATNNGNVIDFNIIATDATVGGHVNYIYSMGDPGPPPVFKFVQVIPIKALSGSNIVDAKLITDDGTGFPSNGQGLYTNNSAETYITGSKERVIGNLWVRKDIYA